MQITLGLCEPAQLRKAGGRIQFQLLLRGAQRKSKDPFYASSAENKRTHQHQVVSVFILRKAWPLSIHLHISS
jgi:hypothetical protein